MNNNYTGLFDFSAFIENLRCDEDIRRRSCFYEYEEVYGPISDNIRDCAFYKDYLRFIKPVKYKVPEEIEDDFNWDLLFQLVAGSFSSKYKLADGELYITCIDSSAGETVTLTRTVSKLWSYQIYRLFEIYLSEQISLSAMIYTLDSQSDEELDFESIFIDSKQTKSEMTKPVARLNNKLPTFEEYLRLCSYLPFQDDGEDFIAQRFDKLVNHRLIIAKSGKLESVFVNNK